MDDQLQAEQESGEQQHEDSALAGLGEHAAQHGPQPQSSDTGASTKGISAKGGATPGVQASAETGATGAKAGGAAGPQANAGPVEGTAAPGIDTKVTAANTLAWNRREKTRTDEQKTRVAARTGAKKDAWTEQELATVANLKGGQGLLVALNERQAVQGIGILKAANKWTPLLAKLPKAKLTPETQTAVGQMVADSIFTLAEMVQLFEVRFGHPALEVSSGATNATSWNENTMKVTWRQLDRLPAGDVTLSTAITTFRAISGGGAFGPSWEAPTTVNTVDIGQDNGDTETLEHTVRHEIGHGVHSQLQSEINPWLQNDMDFWFIDFDKFIADLGGYPANFHNPTTGNTVPFNDAWKGYIKGQVESFCGSGGWDPGRATPETGMAPNAQAAWAAMPAPLKNACAQSKSHWYQNYKSFQVAGGKRYFLNHYYHRPFTIGSTAMNAITATNDDYTAMSEKEFFANCYAEYFANPAGVKNHAQWGGKLPANVKSFFADCIVDRSPYTAHQKKQRLNKATV